MFSTHPQEHTVHITSYLVLRKYSNGIFPSRPKFCALNNFYSQGRPAGGSGGSAEPPVLKWVPSRTGWVGEG